MFYDPFELQRRLNAAGFGPLTVDGIVGPLTEAAIVAFKRSIGFNPRAYVGPLTWAALEPVTSASAVPWMAEAVRMKGLHEARDTPKLRGWFDRSVAWVDPREIAWCGAFVATVMRKWKPDIALPDNPLGARNWGEFGRFCQPELGCILTFWRGSRTGWTGHVGFYWGEDADAYHVLGGNQQDAVTVARMSKERFLSARWPEGVPLQQTVVRLTRGGTPLSFNEA